jgi:WD40 repeat protein
MVSSLYRIVPLKFHPEISYDEAINQEQQINIEIIKNEILQSIHNNRFNNRFININEQRQTLDIIDKLRREDTRYILRKVQIDNTTYNNIHKQIIKSVSVDEPISAISACGVSDNEINIWYFKENRTYNGITIHKGTVYIDTKIQTMHRKDEFKAHIVLTNKKRLFVNISNLMMVMRCLVMVWLSYHYL